MKKVLWSVLLCGLAAMPAIVQGGTVILGASVWTCSLR